MNFSLNIHALDGTIVVFYLLAVLALGLLIGVGLAAFYTLAAGPEPLASGNGDRLFAHFIVNTMPVGLVGFTLASVFAAAMSTLSSSLNHSATALVNDVYLPLRKQELSPQGQLSAGCLIQWVLSRGKPEAVR